MHSEVPVGDIVQVELLQHPRRLAGVKTVTNLFRPGFKAAHPQRPRSVNYRLLVKTGDGTRIAESIAVGTQCRVRVTTARWRQLRSVHESLRVRSASGEILIDGSAAIAERRNRPRTFLVFPRSPFDAEVGLASDGSGLKRADLRDAMRRRFRQTARPILTALKQAVAIRESELGVEDQGVGLAADDEVPAGDGVGGEQPSVSVESAPLLNTMIVTTRACDASSIQRVLRGSPDIDFVIDATKLRFRVPRSHDDREPSDPSTSHTWHLRQLLGDQFSSERGKGVRIGIVDTGIAAAHAEFRQGQVTFAEFDTSGGKTSAAPNDRDEGHHGTGVAALAGGQTVGIAPGADLIVAGALGTGCGKIEQVLAALHWVAEQDVDVVNLSFVSQVRDPKANRRYKASYNRAYKAIVKTMRELGLWVIAAIGNDGQGTHGSPGNYADVIGVGAVNQKGRFVESYSHGWVHEEGRIFKPEFLAPGFAVYTAGAGGKYGYRNGTSFASPIVAGIVASLLAENDTLQDVRPLLEGISREVMIGKGMHRGLSRQLAHLSEPDDDGAPADRVEGSESPDYES